MLKKPQPKGCVFTMTSNGGPLPVKEILSGQLVGYEIPNIPPKVVRVFLASTGQGKTTVLTTCSKMND